MSLDAPTTDASGDGLNIALIAARFNQQLVDALLGQARTELARSGAQIHSCERVPGSAELPFAASLISRQPDVDAVLVLGVVIAGDTDHHTVIAESTAVALQLLSQQTGIPVINGILTVANLDQARARTGATINRGREFAQAAIEMARFKQQWTQTTH